MPPKLSLFKQACIYTVEKAAKAWNNMWQPRQEHSGVEPPNIQSTQSPNIHSSYTYSKNPRIIETTNPFKQSTNSSFHQTMKSTEKTGKI